MDWKIDSRLAVQLITILLAAGMTTGILKADLMSLHREVEDLKIAQQSFETRREAEQTQRTEDAIHHEIFYRLNQQEKGR